MTDVSPIRVVIADDHALVRRGFRRLLELEPGFDVVGEAEDGEAAIRVVRQQRPDVVLMDIRMPILDGIEATRRITGVPGVRVLVLTTFDLDEYVYDALVAGASGFLLKECEPEELVNALRAAASGSTLLSKRMTQRLVERFVRRPDASTAASATLDPLSAREREVFQLLARGMSNAEMAARLVLGESTIKSHVASILSKLALRDRVHAVVLAYECGLVKPGARDDLG